MRKTLKSKFTVRYVGNILFRTIPKAKNVMLTLLLFRSLLKPAKIYWKKSQDPVTKKPVHTVRFLSIKIKAIWDEDKKT